MIGHSYNSSLAGLSWPWYHKDYIYNEEYEHSLLLLIFVSLSSFIHFFYYYLLSILILLFSFLEQFFSAPRIGNTVFAAFVNRKIPSNYRVEVDTDIITMIPKVLGLYRHAGIPVVIDSDEAGPECVANREIWW